MKNEAGIVFEKMFIKQTTLVQTELGVSRHRRSTHSSSDTSQHMTQHARTMWHSMNELELTKHFHGTLYETSHCAFNRHFIGILADPRAPVSSLDCTVLTLDVYPSIKPAIENECDKRVITELERLRVKLE
jgi:hypothetical protein